MAYGQTGSGKTFTMGSESDQDSSSGLGTNQGLIPRFMSDIFAQLNSLHTKKHEKKDCDLERVDKEPPSNHSKKLVEFKVSASFLEVYGEDVHDLLDHDRKVLPLREDAEGGVIVVGLKREPIQNAIDALKVLHIGTMNRTTASTLMNHTSSRSHAVFTIHLQQVFLEGGEDGMNVTTTSKFTFVDLAGSERMKKTGAEGERAREGIKINEGLLALGNVINALADDERLAKGEKVHVPYRQSKLTRLLQEALGGNSQTLFLACVSPSDTNASETLSTLHYANRARNIKNAPTKNVDANILELQRLRNLNKVLQCELVKYRFDTSSAKESKEIGFADKELFNRKEVIDYITIIHEKANEEKNNEFDPGAFNVPSLVPSLKAEQQGRINEVRLSPNVENGENKMSGIDTAMIRNKTSTLLSSRPSDVEEIESEILDVNPDEDLAILDQLLDLQHRDQEFQNEQKIEQEHIEEVEGELEKGEHLLLQLKDSLKAYQTMKAKYEALMEEVQSLESSKASLADELERVLLDPSKGCSNAIKKKLERVEANLARARKDTRKHQQMYRKAEQEAQKCRALENKINTLKQGRVTLLKKQKEAAAKHREFTDMKKREIIALKRKDKKIGQKMTKLEAECKKHKVNLEKRKIYCDKLSSKLKQTETHLTKLLTMRKRNFSDRNGKNSSIQKTNISQSKEETTEIETFAQQNEEISSMKFLLEKMISDRVTNEQLKSRYEQRVEDYSKLMRELVSELKVLQNAKNETTLTRDSIKDHEQIIEDIEIQIDLLSDELEELRVKLPSDHETDLIDGVEEVPKTERSARTMISKLNAPVMRTLLWDLLAYATKIEVRAKI